MSRSSFGHSSGQYSVIPSSSIEKFRRQSGTSSRVSSAKNARMDVLTHLSVNRASMTIWRLQGTRCHCIEANHHGFFHEGCCYIVLKVFKDRTASLHYWFGSDSQEDERELMHGLAHDIDVAIDRAEIFTREFQGHESHCFIKHFPEGIVYIEGRPRASISVCREYLKRMYVVSGRKYPIASCAEPSAKALDPTKSVILDGFPRIYVWTGEQSSYISRIKAIQVAKRIRNCERNGITHIVVIDANDSERCKPFLKKLQNGRDTELPNVSITGKMAPISIQGTETREGETAILHRVNGDRVLYDMPFIAKKPLRQRFLTQTESYLLGIGAHHPMYVWVGHAASVVEVGNSLSRAKTFSEYLGNSDRQSLCRLLEGYETMEFKSAFCDWREKVARNRKPSRSCSPNTLAVHSRCDLQSLDKESQLVPPEYDKMGSTEVWKVKNCGLQPLSWDEQGIFVNSDCYVITQTCRSSGDVRNTIFYWQGSKSERQDQDTAYNLALSMDYAFDYKSVIIRVLDGKEPLEFMNVIHNTMIVYDKDIMAPPSDLQLYAVTECQTECMRVLQVKPSSTSLTSSAAFVLLSPADCFLWYGEKSGGIEREYAKHMLGYLCPEKQFSYSIVMEGKEQASFWDVLGGKQDYATTVEKNKLKKRAPRLLHYSVSVSGSSLFEDIHEFEQEDISDEDIVVMDTFDEVFVWCGRTKDVDQRKGVAQIAKDYIASDVAGRDDIDVLVNFVSQGAEPRSFTMHFKAWSTEGYGGKAAYDLVRKRLRQENAKINVDVELVDRTYETKPHYPYKVLTSKLVSEGIKIDHKQHHLSNEDFEEATGRTREQFYLYPVWKQEQMLRSARLDPKIGLVGMSQFHSLSVIPPLHLNVLRLS
ncbi:advillin-like [Gigantopelta aegis]|uniref:advillin-like n=1 Tax=Gigantopelta aegis TaxID=1735272 RepID=UPI001B889094|nr:advillin-like [Gigantopelta aegis]